MTLSSLSLKDFTALVEGTFDRPAGSIRRDTRCDEVPGWDSLGHSVLLSRLSKRHHLVIVEADAARVDTVGTFYDRIAALAYGTTA